MDPWHGCSTKGGTRRRCTITDDATTSRQTRGKRDERCQRTRGDRALMGVLRSRGRVERMRGGGIDATTSRQTRDFCSGGKGNNDGDGDDDRKCCAPLSRKFAATALVLAAEAAAALIADDADGGNSGVTIVGRASLAVGGGLIN
jgi:hypothetical protein